jgi:deoxyxylulose-5-phosphate synthase
MSVACRTTWQNPLQPHVPTQHAQQESAVAPAWRREIARRTEEYAKGMLVPGTLFEELGWNYIGPIDGHDLPTLIATLRNMRDLKGPQFLHIVTKKGKGFAPAEVDPIGYHAITKLEPWTPRRAEKGQRAEVFRRVRRMAVRHGRRRPAPGGHHPGDEGRLGPGGVQRTFPGATSTWRSPSSTR